MLIQINIYQCLTIICQYLVNTYKFEAYLTSPDQYLNDSYRQPLLGQGTLMKKVNNF